MFKATETFTADGDEFTAGVTRVADDHEILRTHRHLFQHDPTGAGAGARSEIRATDKSGKTEALYTGQDVDERLARVAEAFADPANRESQYDPPRARRPRDSPPGHEARGQGLRALERMEVSAEAGDRLDDVIRGDRAGIDSRYLAAVSDPAYGSAFWKRLAQPESAPYEYTPQEAEATREVVEVMAERAMSEGTGSAGGFGVPYALDPTIVLTSDGSMNPLRELATVSTISTGTWKGVNSAGVTAAFSDEATETSDNAPTLAQPSITTQKAQAFVPFSIEVGEDYMSLQQELGNLFADAKDQLEADRFTFGTASAHEPEGILVGGTAVVSTAGTATYAVADVYSLQEAVGPRFHPNAVWLTSNAVKNKTRRFVAQGSTTEPSLFSDDESLLLGKPWNELSTLSSATTSSNALIAVYGDLGRGYRIVDRIGLSVELVPHLFGSNRRPTGQRGLYAYWRVGAAVTNPLAYRVLKVR